MEREQERSALDELVEEVALLLEATVRADEDVFHLAVPISGHGDGEDGDGEADEPAFQVTVTLSASEDGATVFATRRLCAHDGSLDLEELLRAVSDTIHVQLSIDEDEDIVLGGAAPMAAPSEWIADMVGELAEFAPDIAEDAAPLEEED